LVAINRESGQAKEWLDSMPITLDQTIDYGVTFDNTTNRVHIPIYSSCRALVGGQLRYVGEDRSQPKYLTWKADESQSLQEIISVCSPDSDTLVITEDIMSAVCVNYLAKVDAMPLLGLNMYPDTLVKIKDKGYQHVMLWFDNDVPEVFHAYLKIRQLLRMVGMRVHLCDSVVEPKKCMNDDRGTWFIKYIEERKKQETQ
jgi:DNA primase